MHNATHMQISNFTYPWKILFSAGSTKNQAKISFSSIDPQIDGKKVPDLYESIRGLVSQSLRASYFERSTNKRTTDP